jgi:hypothetical protein
MVTVRKVCADCGAGFDAKRAAAKYCGDRCRKRAQRRPRRNSVNRVDVNQPGAVEQATAAGLAGAGRAGSPAGQCALVLAQRIDQADGEPGGGLAALVREHRAALADALAGVVPAGNPLDELRRRRERRFARL